MPLFNVIPTDHLFASAEIDAPDAARVFSIVQNLDCKEAESASGDGHLAGQDLR
jgi:hypothetical protein